MKTGKDMPETISGNYFVPPMCIGGALKKMQLKCNSNAHWMHPQRTFKCASKKWKVAFLVAFFLNAHWMYIGINVHSTYIISTFNNLHDVHFNVHSNYIRKSIACTFNVPRVGIKHTSQ